MESRRRAKFGRRQLTLGDASTVAVREADPKSDCDAIGKMILPVIQAGETYPLPRDWTATQATEYWFAPPHRVYIAEIDGSSVGTYYLQPNQIAGGGHVANCGYITDGAATGRGVARAMCAHSLGTARSLGFRAMQFNLVISTNTRAAALWQSMGFEIVGTLPGAFHHPAEGDVDAYVMYQRL